MTALDTLRTKVEEAKANLPIALVDRPKAEGPLDALLAAHRALVVQELAEEPDAETLENAALAIAIQFYGVPTIKWDAMSTLHRQTYLHHAEAAAPLLTAPLAAKLAALGDQVRALGGTP